MTDDTWGRVRSELEKEVGANNYTTWIEPLRFTRADNGVAHFDVPTSFVGTWVQNNFGDRILRHLNLAGAQVERIVFDVSKVVVQRPVLTKITTKNADREIIPSSRVRQTLAQETSIPLDPKLTFDGFVVGKPNELAHAAARRVAEGGPVSFNPLFLYGGVGLGKTHLMHAIAWEAQKRNPELTTLYLSAEQFMYRFVRALRQRDTIAFKDLFRSVDILLVDDVQFIAGKDSTQDEFFHTFNALIDQKKQIILSADRAPGEIDGLEDRIKSRLQRGLVVDLHPTDYELRLGILQQKLEEHVAMDDSIVIADGVLEFLARRISNNVRVLEGALIRLFAFGSLVNREITLEVAQECLADVLRASERKVTVDEIMRQVCDHYNLRIADLLGPKRTRTIARPRQVAMYLAKKMTQRSLPEIGRRFGGRDHTTVIHAVRKITELQETDTRIAEDVTMLRRTLES